MSKWTVIGEWGEHTPPNPIQIKGTFITVAKRKPHTALRTAERVACALKPPAYAKYHRYVIVGPDGRRFSPQALRNMIGGKGL